MNEQSVQGPDIRPWTLSVDRSARAGLKGQQAQCLWLTGLSGAGKSTLANALELELNRRGRHTYILDGDNVRSGLCKDLGMCPESRRENIRRMAEVARLMVDAGLIVIVSAISPFRVDRDQARALFPTGGFSCVYVSTPFATCAERDPKGLYKAALAGRIRDFTGLDSPYEAPVDAECEIDTSRLATDQAVMRILDQLGIE